MRTKITFLILALAGSALAKENTGSRNISSNLKSITAGCAASSAKTELSLNNVRTVILINGDMWWDAMAGLGPQYEIPKGSGKHSLYSGALWIGGKDASENLRLAAQTYRQGGSDFWPGPLDTLDASTTPGACIDYDRHWKVTLQEVIDHQQWVIGNPPPGYSEASVPEAIKTWPGTGNYSSYHQSRYLAPYVDVDGDMQYDYHYDYINHNQLYSPAGCGDYIFGDQCIWWVFNDNGNIHTETGGTPIGMEIQAQAFAFTTNDEINNMTFYNYKIINRSSTQLNENYFGVWVDADLGFFNDDYVGCDVPRGLGYCYNGDADDEGPTGYGLNPPAVGADFFQGPLADSADGVDNDRDCIIDEMGEQIIMSRFVFYNNTSDPVDGNPMTAADYYNYLRGIWRNGQPMTYGGNGKGGGTGATNTPCFFMFPGNTDHDWEWGTGGDCATNTIGAPQLEWTEVTAGNLPLDRRFLHSAGPFTLGPGAVNLITTGMVWARATQGGPQASVNLLRIVDDKAQALFDNCFAVPNGPDAPDITLRELDKEIILTLSNSPTSNNYVEGYYEKDPDIFLSNDTLYRFQGYQIFQLKDQTISSSELHDPDKARLVAQVDIKDSVAQIVNHYKDFSTGTYNSVVEVEGNNQGIRHSFRMLADKFATGDNRLINHKNYFYMALAYGFNASEVAPDPYLEIANGQDGKKRPYLPGRRNVKVYTAIPHIPSVENYGQTLNSDYGNGPRLRRVEGSGNGYLINYHTPDVNSPELSSIRLTLDLTAETVNEILDAGTGYRSLHPEYEGGRGPVNIKVIDPVKVPNGDFILWLENTNNNAQWHLKNITTGVTETADAQYGTLYEQLFPEWGLSVTLSKIEGPLLANDNTMEGHGFVDATMTFADPNKPWLSGVADQDGADPASDWILSPTSNGIDPDQHYEKILGGIWAPYRLTANAPQCPTCPAYSAVSTATNLAGNLNSIDLIITRDKSKWSRCVVVESNNTPTLAEGGAAKGKPRKSFSVDKNGVYAASSTPSSDPESPNFISGEGMGWFPGYAIDVEKGERLNIIFSEDSWLAGDNGRDMKWNPTSRKFSQAGEPVLGGMHYIYIVNSNKSALLNDQLGSYDNSEQLWNLLSSPLAINALRVYKNVTWVNFPLTVNGYSFENGMIPPCDVRIRLRVARPYSNYGTGVAVASGDLLPNQTYVVNDGRITYNSVQYSAGETFTTDNSNFTYTISVAPGIVLNSGGNYGYPMYSFSTEGLMNENYDVVAAKKALDLINIVPNPYYAYSAYEGTLVAGVTVQPQLDNRVKIVNLPSKCTISIFTVNGVLVRKFARDVAADNSYGASLPGKNFETSQDWDLKNHKDVPIASGLYLVHVEARGERGEIIGERTLKWFGVLRPIDLDSF